MTQKEFKQCTMKAYTEAPDKIVQIEIDEGDYTSNSLE